jgi:hypothetical protein
MAWQGLVTVDVAGNVVGNVVGNVAGAGDKVAPGRQVASDYALSFEIVYRRPTTGAEPLGV